MNLSLDDQKKLAIACGYEDVSLTPGKTCVIADGYVFDPTSPDTAIRLMEWMRKRIKSTEDKAACLATIIYFEKSIPEAVATCVLKILEDKE